MRFWIIVYSVAIAFFGYNCYTHLNDDLVAIVFGGAAVLALYMWLYTFVSIIAQDFPIKIQINLQDLLNKAKEIEKAEEENNKGVSNNG